MEKSTHLRFDSHLWDNLVTINSYNKQSNTKLKAVKDFSVNLLKLIKQFSTGLKKNV